MAYDTPPPGSKIGFFSHIVINIQRSPHISRQHKYQNTQFKKKFKKQKKSSITKCLSKTSAPSAPVLSTELKTIHRRTNL